MKLVYRSVLNTDNILQVLQNDQQQTQHHNRDSIVTALACKNGQWNFFDHQRF